MKPDRVLIIHNRYQQRGGEDRVVKAEFELLRQHGHDVKVMYFDNDAIVGLTKTLGAGLSAVWSRHARNTIASALREEPVDVVHFHNTFPRVSPSAYSACRDAGAVVIQTLHNFRMYCSNAQFLRQHRPCTDCLGKRIQWPGLVHGCYRGRIGSIPVVTLNAIHHAAGTWRNKVDRFIVLTDFAKSLFVRAGIPARQLSIKPNFAPTQSRALQYEPHTFLYVGRLSPEKGVATILQAAAEHPDFKVTICGDGPLRSAVIAASRQLPNVLWRGYVQGPELEAQIRGAAAIIVPSVWFEGFPLVVAEAYSHGIPVLASDVGSLAELVIDGVTGHRFPAGDAHRLGQLMSYIASNADARDRMARGAHNLFLERYSPDANYRMLLSIYSSAQQQISSAPHPASRNRD